MRQVRTFAYDGLRRKTSQTLPESGTTTYEYNAHGLLEWQTDAPRGDDHLRLRHGAPVDQPELHRQHTGGVLPVLHDWQPEANDRRAGHGQLQLRHGRGCCNSRLDSVADKTTNTNVLHTRTYQAFGGPLTQTLGNGATQSFSYNSRLQVTGITAAAGGHTVMDFSYGYVSTDENGVTTDENTGRVRSRSDAVHPEHSVTYDYDSIYRLEQVQGADESWGISWTFDTWGNRLTQPRPDWRWARSAPRRAAIPVPPTATWRSCTMRPATRRPTARTTTPSTPKTRSLKWMLAPLSMPMTGMGGA